MLPNDPYMLLSFINMKLRDGNLLLGEICENEDASEREVKEKLRRIGYVYDEARRAFVAV